MIAQHRPARPFTFHHLFLLQNVHMNLRVEREFRFFSPFFPMAPMLVYAKFMIALY